MLEGEGWMVKLTRESHNDELAKSLVGHPYVGRLRMKILLFVI